MTNRSPYVPQPGTFPARAIEHLRGLPPGAELSSAELADALDFDRYAVVPCLLTPKKHGVIKSRKENGIHRWSLGDGIPEPLPEDHEPDEPLHDTPRKPRATRAPPLPMAAPPQAEPGFRAGLWTNGTLEIWRGGELYLLTSAEVDQLRDLLRGAP
jgi:hypothetical protein